MHWLTKFTVGLMLPSRLVGMSGGNQGWVASCVHSLFHYPPSRQKGLQEISSGTPSKNLC